MEGNEKKNKTPAVFFFVAVNVMLAGTQGGHITVSKKK